LLLVLLLEAPVLRAAGSPPLILEHLTSADGLPQSTVMATLQDSRGLIWLGTEDGLVRFDGREMRRYANEPTDPHSLPGQFVWDIDEDATGGLWIALRSRGVAHWDPKTDRFTAYRQGKPGASALTSDNVRAVLARGPDEVWIATTDAGIDILNPLTRTVRRLRHDPKDPESLSSDDVVSLSSASGAGIWVGTNGGLQRWDPQAQRFFRFGMQGDGSWPLQGLRIMDVHEDRAGTVWVATFSNGLLQFDSNGGLIAAHRADPAAADALRSDEIRALLEDAVGRLWIGTADGLHLFDRSTGSTFQYTHDSTDPASLRDPFVMSLYEDTDGVLWIGTRSGGVSRWNPRSWLLGFHRPSWLGNEPVTAFADVPDGTLWLASLHAGLVHYDPARREPVSAGPKLSVDLGQALPMSLLRGSDGTLWVGTMAHGLKSLSSDGKLRSIAVDPGNDRATSSAGIMSLMQSLDRQIWIGTYGGGVNILHPESGRIRQIAVGGTEGTAGPNITTIAQDRAGNVWVGSDGHGLTLMRPDGTVIARLSHQDDVSDSLPTDAIYDITIDADDTVWIGMEGGGLARVEGDRTTPESLRFRRYGRDQGMFDTVYGVVAGKPGELWLSGNTGLVRFTPGNGAARAFRREHGLQGDEFSFGAHHRLANGQVAFGGAGGFNLFDPANLAASRPAPRLVVTGLSVMGVPRATATPIWNEQSFDFGYRDKVVAFDFGVLDYSSIRGNRLAYRMPGLTDEWIDVGPQHRVTLTNLDAGTNTLEVRAASPDSDWSDQPLRLTLKRSAPPWLSAYAYAAYASLVVLGIGTRVRHQRRKYQQMEEEAERIKRVAYFDSLTGLVSRHRCMQLADQIMTVAAVDNSNVVVICLDLLGLKRVNESFGHQRGDDVLRAFALRLQDVLSGFAIADDLVIVSRFGGDEFVVVVKSPDAESLGKRIAAACLTAFKTPIEQHGMEYFAAPSVGLACSPHNGRDAETLFKCADAAASHARVGGNIEAVAYSDELADRRRDWLDLESRLRHAVREGALSVVYQPKFRIHDRKLVGLEALMRWHDPIHGDVPPVRFIQIAEHSGLILEMGEWLVRTVCRQQRAWLDQGIEVPVAVNCSGKELMHGDPAGLVYRETSAAEIPPSLIEVELTESVFVNDSRNMLAALQRLRSMGCRIALDDFGTGYSSLAYLVRFPPDRIKIDKSFVRDVDRTIRGAAVASAIVSLAQNLQMTVTAEGVERVAQVDWLRSHGCHEAQGYLFAKPLTVPELEQNFLVPLATRSPLKVLAG